MVKYHHHLLTSKNKMFWLAKPTKANLKTYHWNLKQKTGPQSTWLPMFSACCRALRWDKSCSHTSH